jgi:hypothetical protein
MEINTIQELIAYCTDKERICPKSQEWCLLYETLKDKRSSSVGWEPTEPLVLAAWWVTSPNSKQSRLKQQLIWADTHGQLEEMTDFLMNLTEEQWFHLND